MKALHVVLLTAAFIVLECNAAYGEEIIHGHKAKKDSLQYMASVQLNNKHTCGGFLIHPKYVLTAAHCIKSGNMSVVLGSHNISPQESNLRRYAVESKHPHSSYNKKFLTKGYDIALLKLSTAVKLNKDVKVVNIQRKDKPIKPNTKCLVAGWGKTEKENMVNELRVTDVSTIDFKVCQQQWQKKNVQLTGNLVCAGGYKTKNGACQNDSGGPLVCSGLAVGIVSFNWNADCSYPNVPNVYTQISKYINWIENVIKKGA